MTGVCNEVNNVTSQHISGQREEVVIVSHITDLMLIGSAFTSGKLFFCFVHDFFRSYIYKH